MTEGGWVLKCAIELQKQDNPGVSSSGGKPDIFRVHINKYEVHKDLFRNRKQRTIHQGPKGLDEDTGYREVQFLLAEKQEGFGGEK